MHYMTPTQKEGKHQLRLIEKEEFPYDVERDCDLMDGGDPTALPRFRCEQCGGEMYPEYYKGIQNNGCSLEKKDRAWFRLVFLLYD